MLNFQINKVEIKSDEDMKLMASDLQKVYDLTMELTEICRQQIVIHGRVLPASLSLLKKYSATLDEQIALFEKLYPEQDLLDL